MLGVGLVLAAKGSVSAPLIGVLIGALLLAFGRWLTHLLVPVAVALGAIGALAIGYFVSALGRSTEVQVLAVAVSAMIVLAVGRAMKVLISIAALKGRAKSLEARTRRIEEFLQGATAVEMAEEDHNAEDVQA